MSSTYVVKIKRDDNSSELYHWGIKGMRWGVRRYQNDDGTLTDLGKKKYSSAKRDVMDKARSDAYGKAARTHLAKNPGDVSGARAAGRQASKDATATTKINKRKLADDTIKEAVKKDLDATNTVLRETSNASRTASNAVRNTRVKVARMDLSKMSDKELRDRIAREQLESQYDSMFNTKRHRVESGKQKVASVLDGIGTAATITTSALAIALAVKQLRGG